MTEATLREDGNSVPLAETVEALETFVEPETPGGSARRRTGRAVPITIDANRLERARRALERLAAADGSDALALAATTLEVALQDLSQWTRDSCEHKLTVDAADCALLALAMLTASEAIEREPDPYREWGLDLARRVDGVVPRLALPLPRAD